MPNPENLCDLGTSPPRVASPPVAVTMKLEPTSSYPAVHPPQQLQILHRSPGIVLPLILQDSTSGQLE